MMELVAAGEFEVSAVLYEDDGVWIAQGIEYDVVARGTTPSEAAQRFEAKLGAEVVMSAELGDKRPLAGVGPAPQKFWRMFQAAKETFAHERTPLRIMDNGSYMPRLSPRMKLGTLEACCA